MRAYARGSGSDGRPPSALRACVPAVLVLLTLLGASPAHTGAHASGGDAGHAPARSLGRVLEPAPARLSAPPVPWQPYAPAGAGRPASPAVAAPDGAHGWEDDGSSCHGDAGQPARAVLPGPVGPLAATAPPCGVQPVHSAGGAGIRGPSSEAPSRVDLHLLQIQRT
ncbi:hypothetical protein [Streptomyces sp. GC420]|uniref:hypothetical protein n=1 Tax=Streptomyces sp. GC420 TaxID=2697568 RepID=UPI001414D497|nr:hypothetical protein [Streptomyces sp. GC420]NBM16960.1 hypothetical protein [Streptomyces sp. GC420]